MHATAAAATEPVLDSFSEWSRRMRWDNVPDAIRAMVTRELLDYLGGAIAGRSIVGMPAWLQVLIDLGGRPEAQVVGGASVPPQVAALCNGYFGHVLEFDDTHDGATLHAGSAPIPAALAAAGRRGRLAGSRFCEAVLLGIELTCRLGVATRLNLIEGGWIYGALFGHFGAALAAAHILDNRPEVLKNAFGITYCFACGNHQSTREGAPTKHLQPGIAAGNGILAVLMAGGGLEGVKQPLTGEDGLSRVYLRGAFKPERALADLGVRYETDRLSFKPYPTCRFTHPAISAALKLHSALGAALAGAERFELLVGPQAHDIVGRPVPERLNPVTRMGAQFSVQWAAAVALMHGEVTPRQLVEEVPPTEPVRSCIARIECKVDPAAEDRDIGGCILRVHGRFGNREVKENNARGHPDNPLSDEELLAKFRANASLAGLSADAASVLAAAILGIDAMPDISPLLSRLSDLGTGRPVNCKTGFGRPDC